MYYNNTVYGISLSDIQYLGINKNRILRLLNSNSSNIIVENHDFLSKKMRQIIKEDKILIPYLYFLSK
jgi:hypothetical protein